MVYYGLYVLIIQKIDAFTTLNITIITAWNLVLLPNLPYVLPYITAWKALTVELNRDITNKYNQE